MPGAHGLSSDELLRALGALFPNARFVFWVRGGLGMIFMQEA